MADKDLETMLNGLEDKVGKTFGIDSKKGYETKYFTENADDLFKLLDNYKKLNENSKDSDALKDLTSICSKYVKGSVVENMVKEPEIAVSYADKLLGQGVDSMSHYVQKNREKVLDELPEESLYSIFINATLFKSESDKEYERIRKLRDKNIDIQKTLKDGKDPEEVLKKEIKEYLETIKNKNPILADFVASNYSSVRPHLLNGLISRIKKEFDGVFSDEKGDNKKKIKEYLEKSYDIAENFISTIEDSKRRKKVWDKNLQGQYLMIAKALYDFEEEKRKKEEDEKDEVKKKAKKLGIKV
jgi:hypothetical protein